MSLSSRSKRFGCLGKDALLFRSGIGLRASGFSEAAEESIHEGACVNQGFQRAKCRGLIRKDRSAGWLGGHKICPVGRDERPTAVGQDQEKIQSTVPMYGP